MFTYISCRVDNFNFYRASIHFDISFVVVLLKIEQQKHNILVITEGDTKVKFIFKILVSKANPVANFTVFLQNVKEIWKVVYSHWSKRWNQVLKGDFNK